MVARQRANFHNGRGPTKRSQFTFTEWTATIQAMSLLEAAIGWLAPAQCVNCGREGEALCAGCAASEVIAYGEQCWLCGARSPGGRTCSKCRRPGTPRHVWLTTNYEGVAAALVKKIQIRPAAGGRQAAC